jgi:hypothetical protein
MRTTKLLSILALAAMLATPACAHDPEPTPCGRHRCPATQQEKIARAIEQEQVSAMRRAMREAQRAVWRLLKD